MAFYPTLFMLAALFGLVMFARYCMIAAIYYTLVMKRGGTPDQTEFSKLAAAMVFFGVLAILGAFFSGLLI